jgi:transcriptional regulator with XRE-family HTH domain
VTIVEPMPTPPAPQPRTVRFDPEKLYVAIDRRRRELRISQREVLRQVGEHTPSALGRLGRGAHPSADLLCRLLVWLGDTDISSFVTPVDGDDLGDSQ